MNKPANPSEPSPPAPVAAATGEASDSLAVSRQIFVTHLELKTHDGQSYFDNGARRIIKAESEPLAQFLADSEVVRGDGPGKREVKVNYRFGQTPKELWRPLSFITQGILDAFEKAARQFYAKAHPNQNQPDFQRFVRLRFRLPDPDLEPESYWLVGSRFNPKLVVLWGCEKLDANKHPVPGLPLVRDVVLFPELKDPNAPTVVDRLRSRLMSWQGILHENLALIVERQEPLLRFLAQPAYDQAHEKVVALKPLRSPETLYPIAKFRPLKRLPAAEITAFGKAAQAFYAKAHDDPESLKAHPEVSAYERELRRAFRLPDVDAETAAAKPAPGGLEPLAELEAGRKKAKPAPGAEAAPHISYWVYGKRLSPRLMIAIEGDEPQERCLCLRRDAALDLPPGEKDAKPAPGLETDGLGPAKAPQTVVEKLWLRRINRVKQAVIPVSALAVLLVAWLILRSFLPHALHIERAEMSNDAAIDTNNTRNFLEVRFNNRLAVKAPKAGPAGAALGQYSLYILPDRTRVPLESPVLRPGDPNLVVLKARDADFAFDENRKYLLHVEGVLDTWKNKLGGSGKSSGFEEVTVTVSDSRPPGFISAQPASDGSLLAVLLTFNEPLERKSAEDARNNYNGLSGPGLPAVQSAELQADPRLVLLKVDKPFESGGKYSLTFQNLKDASRARNTMPDTPTNFVYLAAPLSLKWSDPAEAQYKIKVEFSRAIDHSSAQGAFKLDKNLQVGAVTKLDDKTVELVLSNSHMVPGQPYTLTVNHVRDPSGKPGGELTTNVNFAYKGPVDTVAPALTDLSAGLNYLLLTFNKDLNEDAARKEEKYSLLAQTGTRFEKLDTRINPDREETKGKAVRLNFPQSLPNGALRVGYTVEDLAGNTTSSNRDFSTGIGMPITPINEARLDPTRTRILLALRGRIDKSCKKAANFRLEDLEGKALPDVEVVPDDNEVKMTLNAASTDIVLPLNRKLNLDKFRVHYFNLKLEGEYRLQSDVAPKKN